MDDGSNASDFEVIRKILEGRVHDYRILVARYQGRTYSLILRQVRDPELAEELTQDVFFKAYKNLSSFRKEALFSTWLIRIAMNTCNSYFRSKRFKHKIKTISLEARGKDVPANNDAASDEHMAEILTTLLGTLPPKYREPLVMSTFENRTYAETAELLGIPVGTVCSRMNTALNILRKKFKRYVA